MILVFLIITLGVILISYIYYRDISHPTIIGGIIWGAVYFLLLIVEGTEKTNDLAYGHFFMAHISFVMGNAVCGRKKINRRKYIEFEVCFDRKMKNSIFLFEYVFAAFLLYMCIKYAVQASSLWTAVRRSPQLRKYNSGIYAVIQTAIPVVFMVFWGIFLYDGSKENRRNLLLSIPPLFPVILFLSRGGWFFIIITMVLMYIYIKKPEQKTILKYGMSGFIIFILIFVISTLDKYSNAWTWMDNEDKVRMMLESYFLNPVIAYVNWYHEKTLLYGYNTFRFFMSVLHKIGFNVTVMNTVVEFVETNGISGNVYTVLRWYAEDFGIWWAIAVQFILGIIYGKLYKNETDCNQFHLKSIIWLSMLTFPLINQFFDDKYMSIFSMWLQRGIWLHLLTKQTMCIDIKRKLCIETKY